MSDPDAAIDARVAPAVSEPVFVKRRVGAFSSTDLETYLRANSVDTIALAGFSTSGVILSTLCWAADRDFRVVVISDLCADCEGSSRRCGACLYVRAVCVCGRRSYSPTHNCAVLPAADKEVHDILTTKVFLKQAHVMTSAEILDA